MYRFTGCPISYAYSCLYVLVCSSPVIASNKVWFQWFHLLRLHHFRMLHHFRGKLRLNALNLPSPRLAFAKNSPCCHRQYQQVVQMAKKCQKHVSKSCPKPKQTTTDTCSLGHDMYFCLFVFFCLFVLVRQIRPRQGSWSGVQGSEDAAENQRRLYPGKKSFKGLLGSQKSHIHWKVNWLGYVGHTNLHGRTWTWENPYRLSRRQTRRSVLGLQLVDCQAIYRSITVQYRFYNMISLLVHDEFAVLSWILLYI